MMNPYPPEESRNDVKRYQNKFKKWMKKGLANDFSGGKQNGQYGNPLSEESNSLVDGNYSFSMGSDYGKSQSYPNSGSPSAPPSRRAPPPPQRYHGGKSRQQEWQEEYDQQLQFQRIFQSLLYLHANRYHRGHKMYYDEYVEDNDYNIEEYVMENDPQVWQTFDQIVNQGRVDANLVNDVRQEWSERRHDTQTNFTESDNYFEDMPYEDLEQYHSAVPSSYDVNGLSANNEYSFMFDSSAPNSNFSAKRHDNGVGRAARRASENELLCYTEVKE
ncbi:hypothetical protein ADEAN_000799800 [Angomonas deanei]|uniref:Uncharacterized protein n=1 Tax=Angomonas deanei TaxID=59799 RepID=A0A7G2CKX3_9TRYP|nr:hypothetical protein ADEAN_000799800 [Angomonas deanei]